MAHAEIDKTAAVERVGVPWGFRQGGVAIRQSLVQVDPGGCLVPAHFVVGIGAALGTQGAGVVEIRPTGRHTARLKLDVAASDVGAVELRVEQDVHVGVRQGVVDIAGRRVGFGALPVMGRAGEVVGVDGGGTVSYGVRKIPFALIEIGTAAIEVVNGVGAIEPLAEHGDSRVDIVVTVIEVCRVGIAVFFVGGDGPGLGEIGQRAVAIAFGAPYVAARDEKIGIVRVLRDRAVAVGERVVIVGESGVDCRPRGEDARIGETQVDGAGKVGENGLRLLMILVVKLPALRPWAHLGFAQQAIGLGAARRHGDRRLGIGRRAIIVEVAEPQFAAAQPTCGAPGRLGYGLAEIGFRCVGFEIGRGEVAGRNQGLDGSARTGWQGVSGRRRHGRLRAGAQPDEEGERSRQGAARRKRFPDVPHTHPLKPLCRPPRDRPSTRKAQA